MPFLARALSRRRLVCKKVLQILPSSKEIAKAISEEKSAVDLAVKELAFEDKVEYLYITTTFVALKGKVAPPE